MSGYEVSISFDYIEDNENRDKAKRLVAYQSLLTKDTDEEKRAATKN